LDYADLKGLVRQASAKRTLRKNPQKQIYLVQIAVGSIYHRILFAGASREGCRMSKRCILKLVETNGRGRSGLAAALPGQLHSHSGCLLPWTNQQPPSTATLVRGAGETDWWTSTRSVRPSSHAAKSGAPKHGRPAAGKQAGTQRCRLVGA